MRRYAVRVTARCPECDREYHVRSELAGRRVACKCGARFTLPTDAAEREPETYELAVDDAAGAAAEVTGGGAVGVAINASGGRCPGCNITLRPGAVLCLNCGFNLQTGERVRPRVIVGVAEDEDGGFDTEADAGTDSGQETRAAVYPGAAEPGEDRWANVAARSKLEEELRRDQERLHHRSEHTLPLVFLVAGLAVMLLNALVLAPATPMSLGLSESAGRLEVAGWTLLVSVVFLALQVPCLFVGIVVVSTLFGSAFGTLGRAVYKLIALALLCGGFHFTLTLGLDILLYGFGFLGWLFKAAASLTLFYLVAKQLFDDLEPNETAALWAAMIMLPVAIVVGVYLLFFY